MLVLVIDGPTFIDKGWDFPEEIQSETSRMHEGLGDWADSAYHWDKFQPERWLRSGEEGRQPLFDGMVRPFMPFSSGKRAYWGQRLAYLEVKLIITLLVWNFRFGSLPPELHDWKIYEDIFSKPKNTFVRIETLSKI